MLDLVIPHHALRVQVLQIPVNEARVGELGINAQKSAEACARCLRSQVSKQSLGDEECPSGGSITITAGGFNDDIERHQRAAVHRAFVQIAKRHGGYVSNASLREVGSADDAERNEAIPRLVFPPVTVLCGDQKVSQKNRPIIRHSQGPKGACESPFPVASILRTAQKGYRSDVSFFCRTARHQPQFPRHRRSGLASARSRGWQFLPAWHSCRSLARRHTCLRLSRHARRDTSWRCVRCLCCAVPYECDQRTRRACGRR